MHFLEDALGPHHGTTGGVADFSAIVTEICDNQRPVACRIQLNGGAGYHYIAIIGVSVAQQTVRIADPLLPDGTYHDWPYATLCSSYDGGGYDSGVWDQTITIR